MKPPVLKVRLIEEVKALQTGNKGRRFGPRHHLISSKNQKLPTQYVTTNPFKPCKRNAHMHTSSYRAVIRYFVDLNVYFVCICAKGKKIQKKFCCILSLQIYTVMFCFQWQMMQEMSTASTRGAYCNTLPTTSQTGARSTGFISIVPPAKLFNPPYCPFLFNLLVSIQPLPRYYCVVELNQLFPVVAYCWQCPENVFCFCLVNVKVGVCVGERGRRSSARVFS